MISVPICLACARWFMVMSLVDVLSIRVEVGEVWRSSPFLHNRLHQSILNAWAILRWMLLQRSATAMPPIRSSRSRSGSSCRMYSSSADAMVSSSSSVNSRLKGRVMVFMGLIELNLV